MELLQRVLRKPTAQDDKYSRGVVGFVTGSSAYPGAAVLGVTAAIRTGIGMVRYLGPETCGKLLLESRPEVVLQDGRAQAWVLGSGVPADDQGEQKFHIVSKLLLNSYSVLDAGALEIADFSAIHAKCVLTPHAGELVRLLARFKVASTRTSIEADPIAAALRAAFLTQQTVLLKGNVTTIADQHGFVTQTPPSNTQLATAGSGDVLAGLLGALIASNNSYLEFGDLSLADLALAAALIHAEAGALAARAGPIAALDIAEAIQTIVRDYVS